MNNPRYFFEVSADGENIGRMVFELREDLVPKTVENFKKLCEGFDNKGFKSSIFHRIIPGFMCQVRRHLSARDDHLVGGAVCACVTVVCVCVCVYSRSVIAQNDGLHSTLNSINSGCVYQLWACSWPVLSRGQPFVTHLKRSKHFVISHSKSLCAPGPP